MEYKFLSFSLGVIALAVLALTLAYPKGVGAQYNAGAETKSISVDKKVSSIKDNVYFDNIDKSQKLFYAGDIIEYSVAIENTGKDTLKNIKVVDSLPPYLSLIFNPGTYIGDKNSLEWTIETLNSGEVKTYNIRAKINSYSLKNTSKLTNNVKVTVDNVSDSDNASIFLGINTIPATGDNTLPIKTAVVIALGLGGLYVRKFARGY